jgi:MutS domain V/MutS domain III
VEGRRQGAAVGAVYRERLLARQAAVARDEALHARLSWTRLGLVGVAIVILIWRGSAGAPWLAVPLAIFVPLAFYHGRLLNRRDRAARAAAFYERGIARLEHAWAGTGSTGERFRDPDHLYADDLDLFGHGSLFELLATTRTSGGEAILAQWLLHPAPPREIAERQKAIDELAPRIDLREDLAVLGPEVQSRVRTEELQAWALAPPLLTSRWPRVVAALLAAITASLLGYWAWSGEPPIWLLPAAAVQSLFAAVFRKRVHQVAHGVEEREQELEVLADLMERIERDPVATPLLARLQNELRATGSSPAAEVRQLARLVDFLSSGHNQMFGPIAAVLLLGTQLAFAIERWRARCGSAVPRWIAAVAEYEALSAMATYRAEHPDHPFPEIVDGDPLYEGEAIAHPLLADNAVPNDLHLGGTHPHLLLVSGSNMSGKSTLLRTVGVNAVLALAGAPVRARRLRLSPLAIGATIRLNDSLQQGRSRFYAEITRIAAIVRLAKSSARVLFLCDELLSGTNSHDRFQGATGIVKGLLALQAIGLVTTHDLALTAIVDRPSDRMNLPPGPLASNVHFEDRFEDDVLIFDYRLRPGVVRTGNAIPLMRSVGLDV